MMTHKRLREVLKNWGLERENLTDIIYDETGNRSESACYVGKDYVIKYSSDAERVEKLIFLARAMEDVGISAAEPVTALDGQSYVVDGEVFFYVTRRLEGSQLKASTMYLEDYVPKSRFIGEVIGQLSLALAQCDVPVEDVNLYRKVTEWAIPNLQGKINLPVPFIEKYTASFAQLHELLPRQIIHRDPNPGNIILSDREWGILDFDLSERNVRIFDPCYAATAVLSESFGEGEPERLSKWVEVYKNIIYGYDEVVKLTDAERKAVPFVVLANQFIAAAWFSEQEKYSDIYRTNVKMTEWMIENFEGLKMEG